MNNSVGSNAAFLREEDDIDLAKYWAIVKQHRWNILGLMAVVTLLAVMMTFSLDNVYRATTTVLIESEQANIVSIEDVYGVDTHGKGYFQTEFEILKSRELSERVVRKLGLTTHPLFDPRQQKEGFSLRSLIPTESKTETPTESEILYAVVKKMRTSLEVLPVPNTQLVHVTFESVDPELAAEITNALAEEYIASQLEAKLDVTVQAAGWLTERLGGLRQKLQESEARLQEYRESADIVDDGGMRKLGRGELEELTQRYVDATKTRSEAETLHLQVQSMGPSASVEQLMSIPEVLLDPLVQSLHEEKSLSDRKVAELGKRYGPKHPKMIAAKADAAEALSALDYQVRRVVKGFTTEYRGATQIERAVKSQIESAKERFQGVNRKEFKLIELEREVEANRQLYDMFLNRAKETGEAEGMQTAHARIIDPAIAPRLPVKPNKQLIVFLAIAASVVLGIVLAFFLEFLNNTVRTPDDVEDKLGLPMLGFLPLEQHNKSKLPFEGFTLNQKGGFSEAIRTVRTSLMLQSIDEPHKVTVVTSSVPGEGKSTVSLNLARALGQVENVLLIDADMRRPTISRVFDLPRGAAGLSNVVAGTALLEDAVFRMDDFPVDVMPSGVIPNNPLELLSSKRFTALIENLKHRYDRIIIDSAPTHAVSDALVLSKNADELVYIVKSDSTSTDLAIKGLTRLREVNAPVAGVILNQVNIAKVARYGAYYKDYYEGYGYTSEEEFNAQKAYQKSRDNEHRYEPVKSLKVVDS